MKADIHIWLVRILTVFIWATIFYFFPRIWAIIATFTTFIISCHCTRIFPFCNKVLRRFGKKVLESK